MTDFAELLKQLRRERETTKKHFEHLNDAVAAIEQLVVKKVRRAGIRRRVRSIGRKLSAAARKKIAAAQKARWAKVRESKAA